MHCVILISFPSSFVKARFEVDTEVNIEELIIEMDKVKDENAALQRQIEELQKEVFFYWI